MFPRVAPGAQPGAGSAPRGRRRAWAEGEEPKEGGKPEGEVGPRASAPLRQDCGERALGPGSLGPSNMPQRSQQCSELIERWEVEGSERRPSPGWVGEDPEAGRGKDPPRCGGRDQGRGWVPGERGGAGATRLGACSSRRPSRRELKLRLPPGPRRPRAERSPSSSARGRGPHRPRSLTLSQDPSGWATAPGRGRLPASRSRSSKQAALRRARAAPSGVPALPMHLPGCAPAMADGSFSLAGHLLRSPGGSTSRLHSIEAILGFTKDDGILGSFPEERVARGAKERDRRPGARTSCPKAPAGGAEPSTPPAPAPAPEYT